MHQTISTLLNHDLRHNDRVVLVVRNCFVAVEWSCPVDVGVGHRIPHHLGPPDFSQQPHPISILFGVCVYVCVAISAFFEDQSVFEPARYDRCH